MCVSDCGNFIGVGTMGGSVAVFDTSDLNPVLYTKVLSLVRMGILHTHCSLSPPSLAPLHIYIRFSEETERKRAGREGIARKIKAGLMQTRVAKSAASTSSQVIMQKEKKNFYKGAISSCLIKLSPV